MAAADGPPAATSARARWCLASVVSGYLAIAVVAGAPNSPLTVLLPAGARPPAWARSLAQLTGATRVGRRGLIGVSWILMVAVLGAFVLVLVEARANRIRLRSVLAASAISLAVSVAAPLLLSRDVYTYAGYGRIEALYGQNPYVARLSSFPEDPFVAAASAQWLPTHSLYGPAFTSVSVAIARRWAKSPSATILAFKILGGLAIAAATGCVALTATRIRPDRASLAVALVGLNPVVVVHAVGGGHIDALIAAPLAAAMAMTVTRPRRTSARALSVTALLTAACLIKSLIAPVLGLWLFWLVRADASRWRRVLIAHVAVVAVLANVAILPFVAGSNTWAPFATLGGIEVWASPSHLVGHVARLVVGSMAGAGAGATAATLVEVGFFMLFVGLVCRLARGTGASAPEAPAQSWGVALLLLALSMPFLLPWYAAWFAPFLGLLADDVVLAAGALATGVLALTLIPADPFYGYSTRGVMDGVHYGAASVLLVVLLAVAWRVVGRGDSTDDRDNGLGAAAEDPGIGSATRH